jgi:hypothetical protein
MKDRIGLTDNSRKRIEHNFSWVDEIIEVSDDDCEKWDNRGHVLYLYKGRIQRSLVTINRARRKAQPSGKFKRSVLH